MKPKHTLAALTAFSAILLAGCDPKAPEPATKAPAPQPQTQVPAPPPPAASKPPAAPPSLQPVATASKPAVPQPVAAAQGAATPKLPEAPKQGPKPRPNLQKTKQLFDSISSRSPGAKFGKIEWRDGAGILLHPGTTPTSVVFDLSKLKGSATLVFWMSGLPAQVLANPKAGTAGVTVELDGRKDGSKVEIKLPRKQVDRFANAAIPVSFSGATTMRVSVDDAKDSQLCDWLFMGVE